MFDLKITGGTVVDGTGANRFAADVAVRDGKIVEIRHRLTATLSGIASLRTRPAAAHASP